MDIKYEKSVSVFSLKIVKKIPNYPIWNLFQSGHMAGRLCNLCCTVLQGSNLLAASISSR